MAEQLTFRIQPSGDSASLSLFLKALGNIERLIRDVEFAATRQQRRRWVVSKLHASAPSVTLRPVLDEFGVVDSIEEGLRLIVNGTNFPPKSFTEAALVDLRGMGRIFRGPDRAQYIAVSGDGAEPVLIQQNITGMVDRILSASFENLGSIEGKLETISVHGGMNCTVWDRVSKAPVHCLLLPDVFESAKSLLGTFVRVRGLVRYFGNGVPRSVTKVVNVEGIKTDLGLPKGDFGSIPDQAAARDPVAFLKAVRGG